MSLDTNSCLKNRIDCQEDLDQSKDDTGKLVPNEKKNEVLGGNYADKMSIPFNYVLV